MEMQIQMDVGLGDESGIGTCERRNYAAKELSRRLLQVKRSRCHFPISTSRCGDDTPAVDRCLCRNALHRHLDCLKGIWQPTGMAI